MEDGKIQYIIELLQKGDTKGAQNELKGVKDTADKTAESLNKLGREAKEALVFVAEVVAVKEAISAAVEYQTALNKVEGALKARGQASPEYIAMLKEETEALDESTFAGNEQIFAIQSLLITFGTTREQMPKLTRAVLDLAAGMGIDTRSAALELAKAMEGMDGPLKRIGIEFDANATQAENVASAIEQIGARFGGMAQAIQTPTGQLSKAVGDLRMEVGQLLLSALGPSIKATTDLANGTRAWLTQSPLAGEYTKELLLVLGALTSLTAGVKGFNMAWSLAGGEAIKEAGSLKAALEAIPKTIQVTIAVLAAIEVGRAVYEGFRAAQAGKQEANSEADLGAQNDSRRKALDALIDSKGPTELSPKRAAEMRAQLQQAFTPDTHTQIISGGGMGAVSYENQISERNVGREADTLSGLFKQLTGYGKASNEDKANEAGFETRKKGLEELAKLQEKMTTDTLAGFDKQRAEAADTYQAQGIQIDQITHKYELGEDSRTNAQKKNAEEYAARVKVIDDAEAENKRKHAEEIDKLKGQLTLTGLTGVDKEIAVENVRHQLAMDHINAEKTLTADQRKLLLDLNDAAQKDAFSKIAQSPSVQAGGNDAQGLAAYRQGGESKLNLLQINKQYEDRKKALQDYYAYEQALGVQSEEDFYAIEQRKSQDLATLETERKHATSQTYQDLKQIEGYAATQFAAGMSNAFMSIIQGTKSAGEAFKEFASQFLAQVAQMIMQTLILRAIQSVLGGGGSVQAGGGGAVGDAGGGMHLTAAAAGVMLAASGLNGVSEVSSPTIFPKFNVLAGEAGKEMLTVLAQPSKQNFGGIDAVLGNAGAAKLAIISQESLSRLVQGSHMMADGGMTGGSLSTNNSQPPTNPSGRVDINVTLSPGLEAQIVQNSVDGARVAVATDLQTDSPIRNAAKQALS